MWWYYIGCLILGIFIGLIIRSAFIVGTIKIDTSNPTKDTYLIELDDLEKLKDYKRIMLAVDAHADLSQK